jgi:glyoxylase-like metal-dependent hydrolase (beta-lactamase superfamily II)
MVMASAYTTVLRGATWRHLHRQCDLLFPGGVGRTTSPENFASLINDVSSRVFDTLPDNTWFYPGHGDDSTLGEQRPHLAEWRGRGW